MPKRERQLVGLNIEPAGISAAEVRVNGRISVERAAIAQLDPGVVRDGEVVDVEGLGEALRDMYRDNRGLGKRVRVGIANQKIVVRVIELPPVKDAKDLAAAVRFQAQDQLPMPLDSAVLDHQVLDVVETDAGPRQRVLLVAARRDMIERVLSAVRAGGLRPEAIDLAAFAMVRALHRPGGPEDEHVLYLSVGGLTNLAVAQGRSCLFTRSSGGGLETLAVELAERKKLTLEHARGWLGHVGLEEPLEAIDGDADIVADTRQVLLDGIRRIAAEMRNSLDFHRMHGTHVSVSRAVLTGPAAGVPGFSAALASELGMPVETGVVDGVPAALEAGQVTVAAGLAVTEAPA